MHKILLFLLLVMVACVRLPTDEAVALLEPTPSLEHTTQVALDSSLFVEGDFPVSCWWEMFQDSQLNRLIEIGLGCNPTLQMVEAQIRTAEQEALIKRSRLFPTIGFKADLDWQYLGKNDFFRAYTPVIPGNITEYEINVDFSYEFDFWGKHRNFYQAALGYAKAEEAEYAVARLALTTSIAVIYFRLQANLQKLELLKQDRDVLTRLFQLTEERAKNGLDNTPDQLASQQKLLALNQQILTSHLHIKVDKHTLNYLLGMGPDHFEEVDTITLKKKIHFPLPSQISFNLLARRPDLMAQIWRVEAAAHLVGAAKADFYPSIDLYGLAGLDSVFFSKLLSWESRTAWLKPALHLPLFTAGRIKANLGVRQAEFERAVYSYNETLLRATQEVADQILTLKTAEEKLQVEKMLVQNKLENRKIITYLYKNAVSNLLDLLNAQEETLKQQVEEVNLTYKKTLAIILLIKALGGGYCTTEVPLS